MADMLVNNVVAAVTVIIGAGAIVLSLGVLRVLVTTPWSSRQ